MDNQARITLLSKTLSIFIAIVILGAIAALIYTITVAPKEKFTEFYVLNAEGKAADYPTQLMMGEEAPPTDSGNYQPGTKGNVLSSRN